MARGDAIFARCNVDWPDDARCEGLSDNNCRWVNNRLWLWCTKARSTTLPPHFTPKFIANKCKVTPARLQGYLREQADWGLLSIDTYGLIVVEGIRDQNSRLGWKNDYPTNRDNPWEKDPKYIWGKDVPATIIAGPKKREKEIEREKEKERLRPRFDHLVKIYPEHRRMGLDAALGVLVKIDPGDELMGRIVQGVILWNASQDWADEDGKYVPKLENFLKDRLWGTRPRRLKQTQVSNDKLG